jgi:Ion channel
MDTAILSATGALEVASHPHGVGAHSITVVHACIGSWGGAGGLIALIFNGAVGGWYLISALLSAWAYLASPIVQRRPGIVLLQVISSTIYVEGYFAMIYYMISAHWPGAFCPPLSTIDAAYFTISTATTTGFGDIHPASGLARLLVSAQMVINLLLVVTAVGTAFQRFLARDTRPPGS